MFTLRTGDVWDNLVSFLTILSCFRWLQEHFLSLSLLGCHYNDLADRCVNTYPRFPLGSIFSYPPLPLEDNGVCPTQIQPEKNQVPVCSADPLHINAVKIFAYFFFIDNSWNFIFHASLEMVCVSRFYPIQYTDGCYDTCFYVTFVEVVNTCT